MISQDSMDSEVLWSKGRNVMYVCAGSSTTTPWFVSVTAKNALIQLIFSRIGMEFGERTQLILKGISEMEVFQDLQGHLRSF